MRLRVLVLVLAAIAGPGVGATPPAQTTEVTGVVRSAATQTPLAGATVFVGDGTAATQTDNEGRFAIRAPRDAASLGVRKEGFLTFQYPLLQLTTDAMSAEVELRTDPPGPESYAGQHVLFLCVIVDAADRLAVRNSCGDFRPTLPEYTRRIIKHNPWNPYFGPAGDRGGVLIATRVAGGAG